MRFDQRARGPIVGVGLIILILVATWKLTLGGGVIARGDLLLYFYPLRDYAAEAIRAGRLPLWNPFTFMGAPFLANSQVGFFYPINIALSWLPTAQAVSLNIVLHLLMAGLGMALLARRGMGLGRAAALAAALSFALGGYLGAQAEHLNQLQVLAWLPLQAYLVMDKPVRSARPRRFLALALVITLQIFAGHTQSLYICLVTLGVVALISAPGASEQVRRSALPLRAPAMTIIFLALAVLLAALMASAQLLPTLELARESARSGGLPFNESASFSWRPWVIGRALLPTYGDPLFPEYISYFGVFGLALAVLGAVNLISLKRPVRLYLPFVLTIFGFVLALGVATPLFGVLYRFAPGFNLFRAQARWLIVFSLGVSLLVGMGAQALRDGLPPRIMRAWVMAFVAVAAAIALSVFLGARFSPEAEYRALPAPSVLAGWGVALVVCFGLMWLARPHRFGKPVRSLLILAFAAELVIAAQFQPYNRAADPAAVTGLRPSTAFLQANPPAQNGRVLALSSLFFDPGDLPEQTELYGAWLSKDELYDRVIASKQKEILSPNLSLLYRIPGVDGYDGGLLPLKTYAGFTAQFTNKPSADGRLREFLSSVPDDTWLRAMAVRYLIADKTADIFVNGVYYDTLFHADLSARREMTLTPYASTSLGLVLDAPAALDVDVTFEDGSHEQTQAQAARFEAANTGRAYGVAEVKFSSRKSPIRLSLRSQTPARLFAVTSIDAGDGSFLSQMVTGDHEMKLVYSGDVKIYQNLRPAPRAFVRVFAQDCFGRGAGVPRPYDPTCAYVDLPNAAQMTRDEPERVTVRIASPISQSALPQTLVLRDACYPGWQAFVDGKPAGIACADGLFRAVQFFAPTQTVEFVYAPQSVSAGLALSAAGFVVWSICGLIVVASSRAARSSPTAKSQKP
ncbi:MAG TPA: YfhO family protein [Thermoflexales bacterium]|nr:YfhO family protein [Thermoflexales bacterium]